MLEFQGGKKAKTRFPLGSNQMKLAQIQKWRCISESYLSIFEQLIIVVVAEKSFLRRARRTVKTHCQKVMFMNIMITISTLHHKRLLAYFSSNIFPEVVSENFLSVIHCKFCRRFSPFNFHPSVSQGPHPLIGNNK